MARLRHKCTKGCAHLSPAAQAFVSRKIRYLVVKEGYSVNQAAAIAYSMARKRGYHVPRTYLYLRRLGPRELAKFKFAAKGDA